MTESALKPEVTREAHIVRSPSYPNMTLSEAVEAIRKIEKPYRTAPVDRGDAAKLLGYTAGSGPSNKALADLAAYGLVERAGKGELRVTQRAQAILYPDSASEFKANLRAAAFEPALFRDLRDRFEGLESPPEGGIATYLNRVGFNTNSIRPATKAYLGTLEYLKQHAATESHSQGESAVADSSSNDGAKPGYGGARVDDLVQWESQGVLQFAEPKRVRLVSEDGEWVAVDGSDTGIPMSEVIVETPAAAAPKAAPPRFPLEAPRQAEAAAPPPGMRKVMWPIPEGDVILMFPSDLSDQGFDDLKAVMDLFIQQQKREHARKANDIIGKATASINAARTQDN